MATKNILNNVDRRSLTSNTQRVGFRLLTAPGTWVSRKELERSIPNVASRLRDLRKVQFGGFTVECASATELKRNAAPGATYYRISKVTQKQVQSLFKI